VGLGEINLAVDSFGNDQAGWVRVGASPYLDDTDVVNRIESNITHEEIGEFGFENTAITGKIDSVRVAFCTYGLVPFGTYDVYMWESVGGWANVGSVTVTGGYQRHSVDVTAKFDTWAKINEAKMRLRRSVT